MGLMRLRRPRAVYQPLARLYRPKSLTILHSCSEEMLLSIAGENQRGKTPGRRGGGRGPDVRGEVLGMTTWGIISHQEGTPWKIPVRGFQQQDTSGNGE
jgi:hypothetical protein